MRRMRVTMIAGGQLSDRYDDEDDEPEDVQLEIDAVNAMAPFVRAVLAQQREMATTQTAMQQRCNDLLERARAAEARTSAWRLAAKRLRAVVACGVARSESMAAVVCSREGCDGKPIAMDRYGDVWCWWHLTEERQS